MNATLKSILLGLALGLAPVIGCGLLFYGAPYLVEGNPGTLLSFAIMGLFLMSSVGVFIMSITLITRDKGAIGGVAILVQVIQWAVVFYFLAGG